MIFGQMSFRRILLSRLLLLSLPVLLMGVYVTYRKARSAFLETARQNLTESAVRKGASIRQSIEALEANTISASDSVVLKLGSPQERQAFLEQLAATLPTRIECVQLADLTAGQLTASTCQKQLIASWKPNFWPQKREQLLTPADAIYVKFLLPPAKKESPPLPQDTQLQIFLAAPVYDSNGQLRYVLSLRTALLEEEKVKPGSLAGYPVVINQKGTILAHPIAERVGRSVDRETDARRLRLLIGNAIAGREDFLHLFAFEKDGVELVAGYSSIPSPITEERGQQWAIMAVTPLDTALAPLEEIQWVLANMILALFAASFVAILYIAWELARPVEQLRDYVLNKDSLHSKEEIPHNFPIREFNQLGVAIKEMIERLESWGNEIIDSWNEAKNANKLKSEFLATTSHELRTPINGIIGCLQILKEGYCDSREEELEFLQQADAAAVHLLGLINDILDLAKIEAGKLSVSIEPVNVSEILQDSLQLQAAAIQKKGLELKTLKGKEREEITVLADRAKLKQVLLNVISNAVKFTEFGSISVSYRLEEQPSQNLGTKYAVITIKDTGIGIPPSQQEKLFRPFVMVDGSTTRKFGGTGLGLAISRNLIQLMGGTISLTSAGIGWGTAVEIRLPLAANSLVNQAKKMTPVSSNSRKL